MEKITSDIKVPKKVKNILKERAKSDNRSLTKYLMIMLTDFACNIDTVYPSGNTSAQGLQQLNKLEKEEIIDEDNNRSI